MGNFAPNPNTPTSPRSQIYLPDHETFILFFDTENSLHLTGAKNVSGTLTFFDYEAGGGAVVPKFAYFWQSVADVAGTIAANNGKALFQTASSNNSTGITTVAASGDITIAPSAAGIYKISQFVAGAEANAFAIFINGVKASGTVYGSGAGTQQNGGVTILTLASGDVVSLRTDNCPAAITLQLAGTTDTAQIVASILFERLATT